MFASYLFYQIIDLGVALACLTAFERLFPDRRAQRWAKWLPPALSQTPLSRSFWIRYPLFIAAMAAFSVFWMVGVQRGVGTLAILAGLRAPWISFVGIGASFYAMVLCFPALAFGRTLLRRREGEPAVAGTAGRVAAGLWLAASLGIGGYALAVEPFRIEVERTVIEIDGWPEGREPLRVVVVADVQSPLLTQRERRIPEIVASLEPDLVVIPGDLIGQSLDLELSIASGRHVASHLEAPLGVYGVNGDVDVFVRGGIKTVLEGTGAICIDNRSVVLLDGDLELAGFDPLDRAACAAQLERPPLAPVRIAVVHRPRYSEAIMEAGFDLVIAGHTHGGQIVVPGFGPPMTHSPLPREIGAGGLHAIGDGLLYVSRGVGTEVGFAPPIRFLSPPEISLIEIRGRRAVQD